MEATKDPKVKLIELIQQAAKHYDAAASSQSLDAIRNGNSPKALADAARYVALSDGMHQLEERVINLIHQYWPKS